MPSMTSPRGREAAATRAPVVEVSRLHKAYGSTVAVEDVSFTVGEGEIFGILGPNGAGKTTTVECISGLRAPDRGSVSVLGLDPQRDRAGVRESVGVQLQEGSLRPKMRVAEVLDLFASFYAHPSDVAEILDLLGLGPKRNAYCKSLSGGQKQRLSIALALIGDPRVAILDELTTGLDPQARRETWGLIERVRDRGVTVLLVTHYMDEAERLCDRVAVINTGCVIAMDTPVGLAAKEGGGNHMRFQPNETFDDRLLTNIATIHEVEHQGNRVVVTGENDLLNVVTRALGEAGISVHEVQLESASLEDAFVRLTRPASSEEAGSTP